jgi:hypothetical protein
MARIVTGVVALARAMAHIEAALAPATVAAPHM